MFILTRNIRLESTVQAMPGPRFRGWGGDVSGDDYEGNTSPGEN